MSCTQLTRPERSRLQALESQIQAGIAIFFRVGKALLEIKAQGLHRETHAHWEDYCRERWGFSQRHALRLIDAAGVVEDLKNGPIGPLPANEAQARELAPLDADGRRAVWDEATAGGTRGTTAAALHALAERSLAGLPAEVQRSAIEASERSILAGAAARQVGGEGRQERLDALDRALRKAVRLAEGLGGDAEAGIQALEEWRGWFAGLPFAAAA